LRFEIRDPEKPVFFSQIFNKEIARESESKQIRKNLFVRRCFGFKQELFALPVDADYRQKSSLRVRKGGVHLRAFF
jgi:hypothetical protein